MSIYQSLSIVQFFFILLCGISVLDFGVGMSQINEEDPNELGFNNFLFSLTCDEDDDDPEDYDCENIYWGGFQFWGYCMIIVAILQLLKALSVESL